jgi:hypothetical protein
VAPPGVKFCDVRESARKRTSVETSDARVSPSALSSTERIRRDFLAVLKWVPVFWAASDIAIIFNVVGGVAVTTFSPDRDRAPQYNGPIR